MLKPEDQADSTPLRPEEGVVIALSILCLRPRIVWLVIDRWKGL